ncbi:MAG: TldD/PmbA family protein [Bdellovibrio sp.]|nr:TldD/PmbA family protein [Bdellovibrio sp.]
MANTIQRNRAEFPSHLTDIRAIMPKLVEILESGREKNWYCFAWLEEVKTQMSVCAITEMSQESLDRGMVLRAFIDGVNFERSTNRLDQTSLMKWAHEFRSELDKKFDSNHKYKQEAYKTAPWSQEIARGLSPDFLEQLPKDLNSKSVVHFGVMCEENPALTTVAGLKKRTGELRTKLLDLSHSYVQAKNQEAVQDDPYQDLVEIRVMMRQELKTHIFVDRQKNMSQTLPISLAAATGIIKNGKSTRGISGGLGGLEITRFRDEQINEVTQNAVRLTKAAHLPPGRYQIITGPDVTGVIAHEAFGHTQEGDTWMKGRSIAENLHKQRQKVGNDKASIVNHPNMFTMDRHSFGTNGSYFFDHEGELARLQVILDKGMLSPPMTDLTASTLLRVPRTANGKRESWRRPLMTRQTNTYFTPGDSTLEELIGMVKKGYLARWSHGGMEDPKGGSLTAGAAYFEEIIDGRMTGKLFLGPSGGHVELSDPVFSMLDKIVAKSNTVNDQRVPEVKFGGCGKYHKEGVDAGCGGPYILWEDINCG